MKPVLEGYGIDTVWTDQASGDALRDIAADLGLTLVIEPWTQANKLTAYTNLRTWVRTDQLELSSAEHVKQDLLGVQRKYTRAGVTIDLLKTPDGRHSDYAPAIAIVASKLWTQPVVERPRPKMGSLEWCTEQREARQKAMRDRLEREERRQRVMGGPQLPWGRR
jgi:hypothetical protein